MFGGIVVGRVSRCVRCFVGGRGFYFLNYFVMIIKEIIRILIGKVVGEIFVGKWG